jgi:hypothetical protein
MYIRYIAFGSVAEFIVPDWGDKVNYAIGLSYRPARLHRLAGRYDNPMPELTISPSQRTMNSASDDTDLREKEVR